MKIASIRKSGSLFDDDLWFWLNNHDQILGNSNDLTYQCPYEYIKAVGFLALAGCKITVEKDWLEIEFDGDTKELIRRLDCLI
jgi:hypothetical protein